MKYLLAIRNFYCSPPPRNTEQTITSCEHKYLRQVEFHRVLRMGTLMSQSIRIRESTVSLREKLSPLLAIQLSGHESIVVGYVDFQAKHE